MFNLKILRSDTGSLYEIPVNSSITIHTIKESLASVTNLSPSNQILLADTNLSSNNTLEYYGIVKDTEIFLFNKKILENMNYLPEEVNLSILDFQIPRLPTPKNLKELEASLNPLNKMFTLEFYLNNHVVGTQYLKELFESKVLQCINCLSELNVQKKSIGAALNSLDDYKNKLLSNYNSFLGVFKKQSPNFEALLFSFESDLNRLKQTKLHESLRTPTRNTLLDCIPELEIRKWSEQCKREYDTLKGKIMEIGSQIESIRDSVDSELKKSVDINFLELNDRLSASRENTKQFQTLYQSAISNSEKIKKALESSRTAKDPNQLSTIIMSFTEIKNSQELNFSDSLKHAELLMTTLILFTKAKNHMNHYVFSELRTISKLQYDMRQLINNFSVWNEAISKQTINFFQLECIHHMPSAYEEALNETSRRKKFGNSIQSNLGKFIESLNSIREEENQKRQVFFERVYQFLPPNVFNSLKDQLPPFQIQIPPFDTNLLPIDRSGGDTNDDDFAVIDSSDTTPLQFRKKSVFERTSSSTQLDQSKLLESQQKDVIKNLEQKLQSTFLLASRTEEKYKDLLEKSRTLHNDTMTSDYIRNSQVEELKKDLEEKKQEISKLINENKTTQKSIETLQAHESELSQKIRDMELENTIKKKQIEEYKDKITSMESDGSSRVTELDVLKKELEVISKQRDDHLLEISALKTQISDNENYMKMTDESKKIKDDEMHSKNSIIVDLVDSKRELEVDVKTKEMKISILSEQIAKLEKDYSALEDKYAASENLHLESSKRDSEEIDTLKSTIIIREKELDENQLTISQNNQTIESLKKEIASLQESISQYKSELDSLRESITHITLKLESLSDENERLLNEINNYKSNEAILEHLRERLDELTNEGMQKDFIIKSSEDQLKANELRINELEKSHSDKEQQSGETSKILQTKGDQIVQLETQVKKLDSQVKLLDSEKTKVEVKVGEMEVHIEKLGSQNNQLEFQNKQLESQNNQLESQNKQLESQNMELNTQLKNLDSEKKQLVSQNKELETQIDRLNIQSQDQEISIQQFQTSNNTLTQSKSQIEVQLTEKRSQIEDLKKLINEKDDTLRSKQKENDYLGKQLNDTIEKNKATIADVTAKFDRELAIALDRSKQIEELNNTLQNHLDAANEEKVALIEELNRSSAQSEVQDENFRLSISSLESKLKEKESLLAHAKSTKDEVTENMRKLKISNSETNEQLVKKIESDSSTIESMKLQIEAYMETIKKHEERISYLKEQCDNTNNQFAHSMQDFEKMNKSLSEKEATITSLKQKQLSSETNFNNLNKDLQTSNSLLHKIYEILDIAPNMDTINILQSIRQFKDNFISLEHSLELNSKNHESSMMEVLMSQTSQTNASLTNFNFGNVAIFQFVKNNVYEAINLNCPHYYLSQDSMDSFENEIKSKSIIIGSIIEVTKCNALPNNEYGVPTGSDYYELTVAKIDQ